MFNLIFYILLAYDKSYSKKFGNTFSITIVVYVQTLNMELIS